MKITRLFDFAYYQLETHNLDAALVSKKNGGWVKTSTKSYLNKANSLSRALLKLGVKKNDKIAVIQDIKLLDHGPAILLGMFQKEVAHRICVSSYYLIFHLSKFPLHVEAGNALCLGDTITLDSQDGTIITIDPYKKQNLDIFMLYKLTND